MLDDDKLFRTDFYNSIMRMDQSMSRKQYEEQAKQITSGKPRVALLPLEELKIDELVDRFLWKDS